MIQHEARMARHWLWQEPGGRAAVGVQKEAEEGVRPSFNPHWKLFTERRIYDM